MDGKSDQNEIAVDQFPAPNQMRRRPQQAERYPDLRPAPRGIGKLTLAGTLAACQTHAGIRERVVRRRIEPHFT